MKSFDKILAQKVTLFDYELIVGDNGKRVIAFGRFAGRAGMIDYLSRLGQWYLSRGYSTPFLSLGASCMYPSLAAAKAAIVSVGEEIAEDGLPSDICPLVFVFTGSGNASNGAQEIFKLLPHSFVEARELATLSATADYYAHPHNYRPTFHEKISPYASVIVNCMYWGKKFPRLLHTNLMNKGMPLVGICDITCDIRGSIEFIDRSTSLDSPFFRYDIMNNSYHRDTEGSGLMCSAVDILPREFLLKL